MTGVVLDVVVYVSAIVCPWLSREALTVLGDVPRGPRHPSDAAAHAAPSLR